MPRKRSSTLTEAELRLMNILWDRGPLTVGEVTSSLPEDEPLAYSSVLTTLRILEKKGYLRHEQKGRAFVYHPLVDQRQARRSVLRDITQRFFNNSTELLMLNILENEKIDKDDLRHLKKMIEESREGKT